LASPPFQKRPSDVEKVPGEHSWQRDCPVRVWNRPTPQRSHALWPVEVWNVPTSHGWHPVASPAEVVPAPLEPVMAMMGCFSDLGTP
jgi:hypothetical protein